MFDVLIVGAGPSGCAAAISARARGFTVALAERAGRARLLPGESLHPGVEPLFKELGVLENIHTCVLHRHTGIWRFGLSGDVNFEPFGTDDSGPWRGFQVNRVGLNQIMRRRALDAGVELVEPRTSLCAHRDDDGWTLEGAGKEVRAVTLMDATGTRSWLARQLGLQVEKFGEPQRIRFGWTKSAAAHTNGDPSFTARPHGWEWNAPIGEGGTAWVRLARDGNARGTDATPRIHRECAGEGWFLLGDAACLTTPAAGNGVLRALMSGMYAVHVHAHVVQGAISQAQGSEAYRSWMGALWTSTVSMTT